MSTGAIDYPNLYERGAEPGWLTSAANKPEMTGLLGEILATRPDLVRSRALLQECRTFAMRAGGGSGAVNGAHDDLVMAFALAQSVRAERLRDAGRRRIS